MKRLLILLLLLSLVHAEFLIERVEVKISDIQDDGSAKVHESIKMIMTGNYSMSLYDSGITNNKLSVWSNYTGLKDVKFHTNPAVVDIRDFRIRPQPRTKCNPIQNTCHGELILDYWAYPSFANETPQPGTGLFTVEKYKPRTKRYTINPEALSFTTTPENNIVLEDRIYLIIDLPSDSITLDINPLPAYQFYEFPAHIDSLEWEDIVLVKFSLVFDVEGSIDKEVTDFFGDIARGSSNILSSPHGIPLVILLVAVIGSYLYILMSKRRGEE
ncbi:hypothetical protein JXA56_00910 [Candidatus Micrarchaeota archaeon]|nr:hypothetical protein [Candidatus Micrarchaeota archaeon]